MFGFGEDQEDGDQSDDSEELECFEEDEADIEPLHIKVWFP